MSSDTADAPSAKRQRTLLACQNCRLRKLSCTGGRPCARCRRDGQECADAELPGRTPLTRKRMTELEQRIINYEQLWHALHPQLPLEAIYNRLLAIGVDETAKEIAPLLVKHAFNGDVSLPGTNQDQSAAQKLAPNIERAGGDGCNAYPPTRSVSPQALSLGTAFDIPTAAQEAANEWNEDDSANDDPPQDATGATPNNDFGTGMRRGVGYMGLSSAATLLRAIQRFAHVSITPLADQASRNSNPPSGLTPQSSKLTHTSLSFGGDKREPFFLPPASETGPLVESYFRYFHGLTPVVHEPTIRAQIGGALPLPTSNGSRVLLNMIFATGAYDSATDDVLTNDGSKYYEMARTALQHDLLAAGSLVMVQGLALMANYLQRRNKPNAGYICLGLAIRMAMALGFHVQGPGNSGLTALESEMRVRVWWGLVTLEAGMSMTFGRPHGISLSSLSTVRLPINTDDEYLTVSSARQPANATHTTRYTALITQARLAQMAFHSLDRVSRSLPSPTVEQVKWCGDYFRDQLEAMPTYVRSPTIGPHRLASSVQIWRARDYRSVLYRPVLLSAAWKAGGTASLDQNVREIVNICRTLALENMRDIAEFIRVDPDPHRGTEWYTLYFGIQASLTILLSSVWEPYHPDAPSWRSHIMETVAWLRQLQAMKQLGTSYANIMENIICTSPSAVPEYSSGWQAPAMDFSNSNLPTTVDGFDFEALFSEIWNGQTQMAGVAGDLYLGIGPDIWEDMTRAPAGRR